jgi:hypothetical protein
MKSKGGGLALAVVRDLRAPGTAEELADFETDVLAPLSVRAGALLPVPLHRQPIRGDRSDPARQRTRTTHCRVATEAAANRLR